MSVEQLAIVLHHSQAAGTDKLVLLGIANHAGDGGAWPAVGTLARYANATPRTVQRSLARLVQLGEVTRHLQAGGLAGWDDHTRPNRYDVTVVCPAWCDRTAQHRPASGWAYDDSGEVVQVEQLTLSTGDTPEMPNHATRRADPVTHTSPPDAGVTPPPDAGVTQTVPVTNPPATSSSAHVTEGAPAHARASTPLSTARAQLRTATAEHRARDRGTSC